MSAARHAYLDYLDAEEWARLREQERMIKWLQDRVVLHKARRAKLVNLGTARARLAAERTTVPRAYRKSVSV